MAERFTEYKVTELSTVTEETLEQAINDAVRAGWVLDGIKFAMRESSKRPSMAFVVFTRETDQDPYATPKPPGVESV